MLKIFSLIFLFITSSFSQNFIDLSYNQKKETHTDFIFNELMDSNTTNNYSTLNKSINTGYLNINSNFNDMIGLNYTKSVLGTSFNYDSKELYLGTKTQKYISIKNIDQDIAYDSNTLYTNSKELTILSILTYKKDSTTSNKKEHLSNTKVDAFSNDVIILVPADHNVIVHKDFELEKFTASTENLYNIAKDDASNNQSYIKPGIFTKSINNNLSFYGVLILGYTQENYKSVNNYFVDANGTKHNIMYNTKVTNNIIDLDKDPGVIKDDQTFVAKYAGFEYGYKLTAQYKIKNISLYLTAYQKTTKLKNKYKKSIDQVNISSTLNNVVIYDKLTYTKKYINFGLKYKF